jgi:hypothetical protein
MIEGFCFVIFITHLSRPNTGKEEEEKTVVVVLLLMMMMMMIFNVVSMLSTLVSFKLKMKILIV